MKKPTSDQAAVINGNFGGQAVILVSFVVVLVVPGSHRRDETRGVFSEVGFVEISRQEHNETAVK